MTGARVNNRIGDLEQELDESDVEIDDLRAVISNFEELVIELEKEVSELSNKNSELDEKYIKLGEDNHVLSEENKLLREENQSLKAKAEKEKTKSNKASTSSSSSSSEPSGVGWKAMTVEASAYTLIENGDKLGGSGLTSVGAVPTANRTIAVDPNVIPYGSLIKYNGVTYIAEDTGGMINGNKVDIFMNTLSEAQTFGRKNIEILVQPSK